MNFYEEVLVELKELVNKKEYDKALGIINTELSMPYVPNDFEKNLISIRADIISAIDTKTPNPTIDPEKIFSLLNSKHLEIFEKIGLIKQLEDINLRKFSDDIEKLLISDVAQELKTILVFFLSDQEVDYDFEITNNFLNKKAVINPANLDIKEKEMVPMQIIEALSDSIYHENIQLFEMARQLTVTVTYKLFPFTDDINVDEMKNAILKYVYEINGLVYNSIHETPLMDEYVQMIRKLEVS